jgi:predicted ABC-type ATPase
MLHEIRTFVKRRIPFAFETTLSGRGYVKLIEEVAKQGFRVHIFFLYVESVEVSISRVRERVLKGGHDIPEMVIRHRFVRSIRNLLTKYRQLTDSWFLFDNSGVQPLMIAFAKTGRVRIIERDKYKALDTEYRKK